MSDQYDPLEVFILQHGRYVADVRREVDLRVEQVRPLSEAGQRRCKGFPASRSQHGQELPPTPTAVPCSVNQYECAHLIVLSARCFITPIASIETRVDDSLNMLHHVG